jgi:hypothetical protein
MAFDGNTLALLDASARVIAARDRRTDLNLHPLNRVFNKEDELVAVLVERVEAHSDGTDTIRRADPALFRSHSSGANLYLVLCSIGTPEDEVTELSGDMMLVRFGPYSNGFIVGADRAPSEQVEAYRARVAKSEREREQHQRAQWAAEDFLGKLTQALRQRVQQHGDPELEVALDGKFNHCKIVLTLEELAYFTNLMGVTIESLVDAS